MEGNKRIERWKGQMWKMLLRIELDDFIARFHGIDRGCPSDVTPNL